MILLLHGRGKRSDAIADLNQVLAHGPVAEAWIEGRDLRFNMILPQMPLFDRPHRSSNQPVPERLEDRPPTPTRTTGC